MFFLLLLTSYSVGPIFSVPGLTYSSLYATITKPENFPSCNNFVGAKIRIWPVPNTTKSSYQENWKCISTLLDTVVYDNGTIGSPDGVYIETDSITKAKVPYFLEYENTFRVYYDWIHYYVNINSTFQKLKEKIQEEVDSSPHHEKAVISGYSLGGNFVRYFLTHYVDSAWKSQYIDSAMFFAAGVDGSFLTVVSSSIGKLFGIVDIENFLNEYHNSPVVRHMPSLYTMFPNFRSHKDYVAIINGRRIYSSEIFDEVTKISTSSNGSLIEFRDKKNVDVSYNVSVIVDNVSLSIYRFVLPFLIEDLKDPDVPCLFVYNSAMPVVCSANITQVSQLKYEFELDYCGSDNIIPSSGNEYAAKNWKNVVFHDLNSTDSKFIHERIASSKELADFVKEFINDSDKKRSCSNLRKFAVIISSTVIGVAIIYYFFK